MARPLKEKSELSKQFTFRTTPEQARIWEEKIRQSGMPKSEFFRRAVENNQTKVEPTKTPIVRKEKRTVEVQKVLFLLSQQSNNINQIAHRINIANKAGKVSNYLFQSVLNQLEEIRDIAQSWRP